MFLLIYSQDETSEMFIGEWAEARGIRDQLFLATKVSFFFFNTGGDHPTNVLNVLWFFSVHFQLQGS